MEYMEVFITIISRTVVAYNSPIPNYILACLQKKFLG